MAGTGGPMGGTAAPDDIHAPRERSATLGAAALRASASLEVDTVLREVVAAVRDFTGARRGVIATVDEDGAPTDDVHFSGLSEQELRTRTAWPDAQRTFAHLSGLPGPLRVDDYASYLRTIGIEPLPGLSHAFMAIPMHHRGIPVGHIFLAEKADGTAFTADDEDVLALFAAQAAAAIGNARTHRAEQRTRAHLEAVLETAPVGVVVVDAKRRRTESINRAARRIVESLRTPGRPVEELIGVIACRFPDGRQIGLAGISVADAASSAQTMRAEEVELSVPDGRSVTALVNVTPVLAPTGDEVASLVVTLQDLAPLRELERQRVAFLGMVSHELRVPLAAVRGSAATLLEDATQLDAAEMREFHRIIHDQAGHMRGLVGDLLDAGRIEAGTLSVAPEPSDAAQLVDRARTTFAGSGGHHPVIVDLPADLPPVMADQRRIAQVLTNLLANAAGNSAGSEPIHIAAVQEGIHVAFSVTDQGRGMATGELAGLFDIYPRADAGGGRRATGIGLAICKGLVEAHGGRIRAESAGPGRGSRFTFTLPTAADAADAADGADGAPGALAAPTRAPPGTPPLARVLVVDDDPATLRYVRQALADAGYAALVTGDPSDLPRILAAEKPDLVLLDLVLPGADGIELLSVVPGLAQLPVVLISGYGRDEAVARALAAGAADYIVKPFTPTELIARIGAALRRAVRPGPLSLGDLTIDHAARRVTVAGREVALTPTEYELLRALALGAGRVVTNQELLERVWPGREPDQLDLLRNFVKQLRAKLGDAATDPTWIHNVRGVGYLMASPDSPPAPVAPAADEPDKRAARVGRGSDNRPLRS